jgi:hypothetical protein
MFDQVINHHHQAPKYWKRIDELVDHIEKAIRISPDDLVVHENGLHVASPRIAGPSQNLLQEL